MHRYFLFTRKADISNTASASSDNLDIVLPEELSQETGCEGSLTLRSPADNTFDQLLQKGYTKKQVHSAIHKYMLAQIQYNKATGCKHKALYEKPSLFAKESHFLKSLLSAIVSLLKTQFAKKPKNPV